MIDESMSLIRNKKCTLTQRLPSVNNGKSFLGKFKEKLPDRLSSAVILQCFDLICLSAIISLPFEDPLQEL